MSRTDMTFETFLKVEVVVNLHAYCMACEIVYKSRGSSVLGSSVCGVGYVLLSGRKLMVEARGCVRGPWMCVWRMKACAAHEGVCGAWRGCGAQVMEARDVMGARGRHMDLTPR